MNKPDWSKAPEGATHWQQWESRAICWLKESPLSYWDYDKWQEYAYAELGERHLSEAIPRPPKKQKKHERIAELLVGKTISGLTIGEARELGGYLADGTNLIVDTSENKK